MSKCHLKIILEIVTYINVILIPYTIKILDGIFHVWLKTIECQHSMEPGSFSLSMVQWVHRCCVATDVSWVEFIFHAWLILAFILCQINCGGYEVHSRIMMPRSGLGPTPRMEPHFRQVFHPWWCIFGKLYGFLTRLPIVIGQTRNILMFYWRNHTCVTTMKLN